MSYSLKLPKFSKLLHTIDLGKQALSSIAIAAFMPTLTIYNTEHMKPSELMGSVSVSAILLFVYYLWQIEKTNKARFDVKNLYQNYKHKFTHDKNLQEPENFTVFARELKNFRNELRPHLKHYLKLKKDKKPILLANYIEDCTRVFYCNAQSYQNKLKVMNCEELNMVFEHLKLLEQDFLFFAGFDKEIAGVIKHAIYKGLFHQSLFFKPECFEKTIVFLTEQNVDLNDYGAKILTHEPILSKDYNLVMKESLVSFIIKKSAHPQYEHCVENVEQNFHSLIHQHNFPVINKHIELCAIWYAHNCALYDSIFEPHTNLILKLTTSLMKKYSKEQIIEFEQILSKHLLSNSFDKTKNYQEQLKDIFEIFFLKTQLSTSVVVKPEKKKLSARI